MNVLNYSCFGKKATAFNTVAKPVIIVLTKTDGQTIKDVSALQYNRLGDKFCYWPANRLQECTLLAPSQCTIFILYNLFYIGIMHHTCLFQHWICSEIGLVDK